MPAKNLPQLIFLIESYVLDLLLEDLLSQKENEQKISLAIMESKD